MQFAGFGQAGPGGFSDPIFNYDWLDGFDSMVSPGMNAMQNLPGLVNNAFWGVNLLNSQNVNQYRQALAEPAFAYQAAVDTQKLKNDALATALQAMSGITGGLGNLAGGVGGVTSNFGQGVAVGGSGAKPTDTGKFAGLAAALPKKRGPNALADMLAEYTA